MEMKSLAFFLALSSLIMPLSGCSSIRATYRKIRNENQTGEHAPKLDLSGVAWVNGIMADMDTPTAWTVFAFFKPT